MNRVLKNLESMLDFFVYFLPRKNLHKLANFLGTICYATFLRKLNDYETIAVQKALLVPTAQARDIAGNAFLNTRIFLVDYQYMAVKSEAEVHTLMKSVTVEGEAWLHAALASKRAIVATTIHMDSFLIGILKLCQMTKNRRPVTVIKLNQASSKENHAYEKFQKMGVRIRILRLSEKPAWQALQQLRKGHIVFVLCDVDPSFGKTSEVSFFGYPAHFPCGLVELAIASQALLLPLVVTEDQGSIEERHILKIESPIDPRDFLNQIYQDKTRNMTQSLAARVESWIRQAPGQWQSWAILQRMWKKS